MQLSLSHFVYAATVFAAAWASPVPDPANQAVATQLLSKRAVPYHADTLQATSYCITNWLHSKHIEHYRVGSTLLGDSFTDLPTLESFEVAPTIKQIVLLTGTKVNHVKLSGCVGPDVPCVEYDAPHGHDAQSLTNPINTEDVHLDLADGEWFDFVGMQTIGHPGQWRKLVYISLTTNLGNFVEAGFADVTFNTANFTAPEGFTRVVGFHGTEGDLVYSLAPIWA